jgi:dTDP-4-dehydrorhamnose 3,5-epimerase
MEPGEGTIPGVHLLEVGCWIDERGTSRKSFVGADLGALGCESRVAEVLQVHNRRAGTLRGLHFQVVPGDEAKTLWVDRGSIFDVIVDVRTESPARGSWQSFELEAGGRALHVPAGCAHGYLTLSDDTDMTYLLSATYQPELATTLRWDDPTVDIAWPRRPTLMSTSDAEAPTWHDLFS